MSAGSIFPITFYKSLYLKNGSIKPIKSYIFAHFVSWIYIFIEVTKKIAINVHSKARCTLFANTMNRGRNHFFSKTGWMCYYTLFVVCCQFSHEQIRHWEFFLTKNSFVFVEEIATSMKILRTAYDEKPFRET